MQTISIPVTKRGVNKNLDVTELGGQFSPNMQNMVVELNKVRKRLGYTQLGSNLPLSGIGMEVIQYTDMRGTVHQIALTTTNAYEYDVDNNTWVHRTPCIDLAECESGWTKGQAADTVTHDTDRIRGTKSMKLVLGAARSDGDQIAYKDVSSADASGHSHVGFWIKSSTLLAASALEVVVSESNHASGEKTGTYVECLATALVADTWTFVQLAKTLTDFNAVISVSLYANATLASGLIIYLDDVRAYTPFTGGADDRWSWSVVTDTTEFSNNGGDALVISNGVDDLFYYEGQSGDNFQTLVHAFPSLANCDEIIEFWNHFMLINYNDGDQHVRSLLFADVGDVDDWSGGTSGSTTLTDSVGALLRAKKLGASVVLYSEKSITLGRYIGAPTIFAFPTLIYEAGLFAPNAVWDSTNVHFLLGSNRRVLAYYGDTHLRLIGEAIEDALFDAIDVSKKKRVVVGLDPTSHKVHFLFPRAGDDYARCSYSYGYKSPTLPWEYHVFADDARGFCLFDNRTSWYCDDADLTGLYCDEVSFYCDDSYSQLGHTMSVFISSDGYIYKITETTGQDDDADIEAIYDTEAVTIEGEEILGRWQWFSFRAKASIASSTVQVYYSIDEGETWTEFVDSPVSLNAAWTTHRLPFDVVSRTGMCRLRQNSSGDLQLRGKFHITAEPVGVR